ncbi:unnamed protein product [Urochloa decumbens]|uniref:Uncharacterized protein n=1 Tax=Urochloa decumbens TaxID=240449 RepID=A0ABC9BST4_9POAL
MDKGKSIVKDPVSLAPESSQAHDSVVKGPIVVDISRKSILRQMVSKIGATIRTEGIVKLDKTKRVAWLTVEFPPKEGTTGAVEVEAFQGIACATDYEAEENVSEIAISHFISQLNIHINDVNYPCFLEAYRQLHHSLSWSQILHIKYQMLRIEKNGLFNAHRDLLKRLSSICASYGDILPLAPCAPMTHPPSIYVEPVMYTGAKPPETRHEQLARELFNIIQENTPNGNPIID